MPKNWLIALFALLPLATCAEHGAKLADTTPALIIKGKPYLTIEQLRAKYGDSKGHLVNIDGVDVYYKDEGTGPAILMIHGSVSTLKTYDVIAAKMSAHYRVIRYDIPPLGLSGSVSDDVAAKVQPTDIPEHLLEKLGVKSATVVGVSSGGTMGMYLAAKRPDLVNRLILSNTPSDPVDTSHLVQPADFLEEQKIAKEIGFQSQHFWDDYLSYFSGDPVRMTPSIREQYYDFNRRPPEKYPVALVARVADHNFAVDAMSKIVAPTLLIWGASDPLLIPPTADILGKYLTHTQVSKIFMPDVGHYPPLEAPERFAKLITDYIEVVTPDMPKPTK